MKKQMITIAALVALSVSALAQGSLTPPGAPAATMKTLEQVEPRTDLATVSGGTSEHHLIAESGSYYLSADLEVSKNWGIWIWAEDVTLDLNGFRIIRVSGSGGYGIKFSSSGTDRATVRNGSISGFNYGIECFSESCVFEKLTVSECSAYGISSGGATRVSDCQVLRNTGDGIYIGAGSVLANCISSYNTGEGIYAFSGTLSHCVANNNQGTHGIHVYEKAVMENCSAEGNDGIGIKAGEGSTLESCAAFGNQGLAGIYADEGSTLSGCTATGNEGTGTSSYGIYADSGSTIIGCTSYKNSNTNSPPSSSRGVGIFSNFSTTIKDCTAYNNGGDGIRVSANCVMSGNTCYGNGFSSGDGAGIHTIAAGNRIDGNNVNSNDRGIDVDYVDSIIVRNSARNNGTNYVISAGNGVGTIQASPVGAGAWDNFEL